MFKLDNQKVLLIGGGLIGSSVGCQLLKAGLTNLTVIDSQVKALNRWKEWSTDNDFTLETHMDLDSLDDDVPFDWILLAVPESATALWLTDLSGALDLRQLKLGDEGTIVTLNSTQKHLVHVAKRLGLDPWHVAVHPIMGSEQRGFPARGPLEINDATAVIGWASDENIKKRPAELRTACLFDLLGFKIAWLRPEEHDRYYAVSSHLTHLLAVIQEGIMPMDQVALEPPSRLVNKRLAQSDAQLWSEVLWSNRDALGPVLEGVERLVGESRKALKANSPKEIKDFWENCQNRQLIHLWRDEIDAIDVEIAKLLSARMQWVKTIGRHKRSTHQEIVDPSRESRVYKRVQKLVQVEDQVAVTHIYHQILAESRAAQVHV